jgi:hypothetical protein
MLPNRLRMQMHEQIKFSFFMNMDDVAIIVEELPPKLQALVAMT